MLEKEKLKEGVLRRVLLLIFVVFTLGAEEVALDLREFLNRVFHAREGHPNGGWYQVMTYMYELHSEN